MSFYRFIRERRQYSDELCQQIEEICTIIQKRAQGIDPRTNKKGSQESQTHIADAPIALVGQVQSGKTRTYLGVIAHCLDQDYDFAIVITKNNTALALQTYQRIINDFSLCDSKHSPIGSRTLRVMKVT